MAIVNLMKVGLIELDGNFGISVAEPGADNRKTIISGTGIGHTFVGQITADSAEFINQVNRRGLQNWLQGTETLTAGVTDPAQMANVTASWPSHMMGASPSSGYNRL